MGFLDSKIREELRKLYGEFTSKLESEYENRVVSILSEADSAKSLKLAWVTYNQVILELKNSNTTQHAVKELLYRLTDNENPNDACLEVLTNIGNRTPEIDRLYHKIKNFK